MSQKVPADYEEMDISKAMLFDKKVKENFMPAIISTVKQIVEDYPLEGICVDIGCGTAVFAIELCKRADLKVYALERVKAICKVAKMNIKKEKFEDRITLVLGDAHNMPFRKEIADFIVSRGAYHCWEDKIKVFREIYRILKKGGIAFVGGGFGRYVTREELQRMKSLRDRSLGEAAKAYSLPEKLREALSKASIPSFRIIHDPAGLWAEIRK